MLIRCLQPCARPPKRQLFQAVTDLFVLNGVQEVASSNLAGPTSFFPESLFIPDGLHCDAVRPGTLPSADISVGLLTMCFWDRGDPG